MPRYRITTPEQVAFHFTVAGLVSRCVAWAADQALAVLLMAAVLFAVALPLGGIGGEAVAGAAFLLGKFVIDFSYFAFFELKWAGQTPGKRLMGLRVVSGRGGRLAGADVIARSLLRAVDGLPVCMVVGGVVAACDRYHRRLGDFVADTLVVRDARRPLPAALAAEKNRVNSFDADPALRARIRARVGRAERDLVLDLVLRRDQIEPAARAELFEHAAAHFRRRLSLPDGAGHLSDEQAVVNLALVLQDARFAG